MDVKDSCIFYTDWLEAARTIENPTVRCVFIEAVLDYALTGMKMDLPPEVSFGFNLIKKQIDRNNEKYERICEKRRAAGKKGGAPFGNKNASKQHEQANQANGCINNQNYQIQSNQPYNDNDNVNDNVNDNDKIINDFDLKSPQTPKRGNGGGAKSFNDFFLRVKAVQIPKRVEDVNYTLQYVWRVCEGTPGYGLTVKRAIENFGDNRELADAIQVANSRYKPSADFQAVKLAVAMKKLKTDAQVKAVVDEVDRSSSEQGIYATMLAKVEYILQGNKVTNLAGFMRSRQ